jgi:purine nucleosidase
MRKKKINLFIDTDPGVDDSLALMLSLLDENASVRGISTTYGNHGVEETTQNARRVIDFLRSLRPNFPNGEAQVVKGSEKPLEASYKPFRGIYSQEIEAAKSWLGENFLVKKPVEDFMNATFQKYSNNISMVCLGPLTNLAKFGRKYPGSLKHIKEVIIMGGALFYPGNFSPLAESNFGWDPDAAKIVLNLPFKKIVLVPLNVTEDFQLVSEKVNLIRSTVLKRYIKTLSASYSNYYRRVKKYYIDPNTFQKKYYRAGAMHDIVAMLVALMTRGHFEKKLGNIEVVSEGPCAGQSVLISRAEHLGLPKNNIYYVSKIKKDNFWRKFFQVLNRYE